MKANVLDNVRSRFLRALGAIGRFLNQLPEREFKSKAKQERPVSVKKNIPKTRKGSFKEVYAHKGSGYKGKGNVNTDTTTFNRLRKDEPHGRYH